MYSPAHLPISATLACIPKLGATKLLYRALRTNFSIWKPTMQRPTRPNFSSVVNIFFLNFLQADQARGGIVCARRWNCRRYQIDNRTAVRTTILRVRTAAVESEYWPRFARPRPAWLSHWPRERNFIFFFLPAADGSDRGPWLPLVGQTVYPIWAMFSG